MTEFFVFLPQMRMGLDVLVERETERCRDIVRRLRYKGPVFRISGATGRGTRELCQAVMVFLEEHPVASSSPVREAEPA